MPLKTSAHTTIFHRDQNKNSEHLGCSRPLCSSQATDGPTTQPQAPTPTPDPPGRTQEAVHPPVVTRSSKDPNPHHPTTEVAAAGRLRTQQRAHRPPPPTPTAFQPTPTKEEGVLTAGAPARTLGQCSTQSNHQTHERRLKRPPDPHHHTPQGAGSLNGGRKSSLERR